MGTAPSLMQTTSALPPQRLLVDCTETQRLGANTGIQRVVRSILAAGVALEPRAGEWVAIRYNGRQFEAAGDGPPDGPPGAAAPPSSARTWLRKAVLRGSRSAVLRASLLQSNVQAVARQALSRGYWIARAMGAPDSRGGIRYRPGDWIVLLDSNWGPDLRPELARARLAGARICVVIYDLIQIDHPELVSPGAGAIYRRWFDRVVPMADRILAISDTVCEEVRRYLAAHPDAFPCPARVDWFHLGADFGRSTEGDPASAEVRALFDKGGPPTFLVVGTIEPRKAQNVVLDAFESLWRDGHACRLIFIGREGWGSHALAARLRTHPERGQRLHWLRTATDGDLALCYESVAALVNASTSEGFGLPLVEALHHGVAVIASDIPVFREVGRNDVAFFPPRDAGALARAVVRALRGELPRPWRRGVSHANTWEGSAREIQSLLFAAEPPARAPGGDAGATALPV